MKKGKIGVQMMMLKSQVAQEGMYHVLEHLTEMGFHAVEISQLAMIPQVVEEMQRAQNDLDMKIVSMSCCVHPNPLMASYGFDNLEENYDKIVKDCRAVNCNILRLGMIELNKAQSPEAMLEMTDELEQYAKRLKQDGINLYYHAHHIEFYRWQGKPMLTHMMERTSALGFELDSHWMYRGGEDPVRYIQQFAGRVRLLHLKDYRIGLMPSQEETTTQQFLEAFVNLVQYAEVGEGVLDMPAIIRAGLESGSEYFLIEQDDCYGRTPYESLQISRDNLIKMGFGDWF